MADGIPAVYGQQAMANSLAVVVANDQSPLDVNLKSSASSSVTMQNAATATGNGTVITVDGYACVGMTVFGTFVGTVTFECSEDGTNFVSLAVQTPAGAAPQTTTTTTGTFLAGVAGLKQVRARISAYTSGSITVTGHAELVDSYTESVQIVGSLPAGSNSIGTVNQGSSPWVCNVSQIGGNNVSTVANGVQKVALADSGGTAISGTNALATYPVGTMTVNGLTLWSTPNNNSNTALTTTVVTVKSSAGRLETYFIDNPNSSVAYVQVFDTNSSVTLGTTRPNFVLGIPANGAANISDARLGFANGIKIAATTTASGSTAPSSGLNVSLGYA